MNITVKKAEPKHIKKILAIENLSFNPEDAYEFDTFNSLFEEFGDNISLIIKPNKKIIGYFIDYKINNHYYLHSIAIHPKYRGKGIATQILWKYRIPKAIKLNCRSILLHVDVNNIPSIALYTKNGFTIKSKIKSYYNNGNAAFLMILKLAV